MITSWLDRALAGLGGAAFMVACNELSSGHEVRGIGGLILVAVAVWLCAPVRHATARRKALGDIITDAQRERFMEHLRDVYGDDVQTVPNPVYTYGMADGVLGDPFGTPVVWCHTGDDHDAHLWPINGPAYAPALCMGHECSDPKRHIPSVYGETA